MENSKIRRNYLTKKDIKLIGGLIAEDEVFRPVESESALWISNYARILSKRKKNPRILKTIFQKGYHRIKLPQKMYGKAIDYLNYEMKNGGLLIVYHTMKLHNEKRFNMVISGSALKQLNDPKIYRDIGYASTSDSLFILAFITSSHDESFSYNVLLKGLCNGMLRMNESKDTIGDYRLLDSLEEILKQNILTTEQLISYLDRIILIANKMNKYHIDNDVHGKTMDLLQEYDFEAAEYYYGQVSSYMETYNQIHYKFAMGLAYRGRDVEKIENVLSNITYSFDNYYQKVDMDIFYLKISVLVLCQDLVQVKMRFSSS